MSTSFKKPRRNFRQKITIDSESDDETKEDFENVNNENENSPQMVSNEQTKKSKKKKKEKDALGMHRSSSVLSFNEDEEGIIFFPLFICNFQFFTWTYIRTCAHSCIQNMIHCNTSVTGWEK